MDNPFMRYVVKPLFDMIKFPLYMIIGLFMMSYFLVYGCLIISFVFSVVCALFGVTRAWLFAGYFLLLGVIYKAAFMLIRDGLGWTANAIRTRRQADEPFAPVTLTRQGD